MKLIKPRKLEIGDTVGVVAPASPPDLDRMKEGILFLKELGLKVELADHLANGKGYLGGTDLERCADLHNMFLNPEVKGIFCACGGYGTARIAASLDYGLIGRNPKIFWGYSDISFLHTSIRQKTGLVTFHGPMLSSDVGKEEWSPLSAAYFRQLFHPGPVVYDESVSAVEAPTKGYVKARMTGGNLCLIVTTLGTEFEVDTTDKILFIEDVNEEPRNIDRMLNQLKMAGKLKNIKGLVIGDFNNCNPEHPEKSFSLEEVLNEYISFIDVPTLKGLKIGHCSPNIGIPLGTEAILDTDSKRLTIESGVC
ncbi:MAG: LD-carboxypeptidase [Bacillus sp. (in: firmicutes)]